MRKLILCAALGVVISLACTMRGSDTSPQDAERYVAYGSRVEQYSIVTAPNVKILKERVTEAVAHGWQPRGGVAITQEGLCQVVVK